MEFVDYAQQTGMGEPQPYDTAARRAYTLSEAIEAGFDPGAYEWRDVPEGTWDGHLDFKTWSSKKKGGGSLLCFFTDVRTGRRFRLLAAKPWEGDTLRCTPRDRAIDFSRASVDDRVFRLRVRYDAKGHVAWIGAIARE
jgi:hypothetical protein